MAKKLWHITDFSGGIADDETKGIKGSCVFLQGLDTRSEPGVLKPHFKLEKDSGIIVEDFCKYLLEVKGDVYAFGDTGKIYKKDSGVWTKVYTDVSSREIIGAGTDAGYIYWATNSNLHRIAVDGTWGVDEQVDWATLTSDTSYHPIIWIGSQVYVGAGKDLATFMANTAGTSVDASYNSSALDLPPNERIKCLANLGNIILLGTWRGLNRYDYTEANLYEWDVSTTNSSYDAVNNLKECGVNSILSVQKQVFIFAGISGNLYYYNGTRFVRLKQIPYVEANQGEWGYVEPGGIINFRGVPHFHFNNAGKRMIYSYGTKDKNYSHVLQGEFPISKGDTSSNIDIGGITSVGRNIFYVAWKDDSGAPTEYGIDKMSTTRRYANDSTPYDVVYYETLIFDNEEPFQHKEFEVAYVKTKPLHSGCALRLYYKVDDESSWNLAGTMDTENAVYKRFRIFKKGFRVQLQLRFTSDTLSNAGPEVSDIGLIFEPKPYWK